MGNNIYLITKLVKDDTISDDYIERNICYTEDRAAGEKFCEAQNYPTNEVAYTLNEVPKLEVEVKLKYMIEGVEYV